MAGPSKKPRFTIRMDDELDKDLMQEALDEVAKGLGAATTRKDAIWYLIWKHSTAVPVSTPLSKQLYLERSNLDDQLFIGEVQNINLLMVEIQRRCSCGAIEWTNASWSMQGHVLSCSIVCSRCKFTRRWISSSLVGTRYTVNARCVYMHLLRKVTVPLCILITMNECNEILYFSHLYRMVHAFTSAGLLPQQYKYMTSAAKLGTLSSFYIRQSKLYMA